MKVILITSLPATPIEELHRHALCSILKNNRIAFEDAEDIAQDALLVYLQNQLKVDNPKAYVNRVCQNKVADKFRAEAREEKQKEQLAAAAEPDPCSQAPDEYNEKDIDIKDILKIIPRKYHELFLQYKDAGFSQAELARMLDVNYNTLKSKIYTINTYIKSYYMVKEGYMYSYNVFNKHIKVNLIRFLKSCANAYKDKDVKAIRHYITPTNENSICLNISLFDIYQIIHTYFECKDRKKRFFAISCDFYNNKKQLSCFGFTTIIKDNKLEIITFPEEVKVMYIYSNEVSIILEREFPNHHKEMKNSKSIFKLCKDYRRRAQQLSKQYPADYSLVAEHVRPDTKDELDY